jgi:prepilin-type N-terminal cleavage/methylation domain-containing protein
MTAHDLQRSRFASSARGFTILELLVGMAILTVVASAMLEGVARFSRLNTAVTNRSEMHAAVRNATALLQQEIGQAGLVSTLNAIALTASTTTGAVSANVNSAAGLFDGALVVVGTGQNEETVTLTAVNKTAVPNTISALFSKPHPSGAPVRIYGGFAQGVVPPSVTDGSTATVLKIFGDINGNGSMVYIEYWCDITAGNLYRRSMDIEETTKVSVTPSMALLNNVVPNPDGTPCFTYQENEANAVPYVVNVALTLTVQTADRDPVTGLFQTETKALLNVAPRNVFNVWQLANQGVLNRVQPTPPSVANLLPQP